MKFPEAQTLLNWTLAGFFGGLGLGLFGLLIVTLKLTDKLAIIAH